MLGERVNPSPARVVVEELGTLCEGGAADAGHDPDCVTGEWRASDPDCAAGEWRASDPDCAADCDASGELGLVTGPDMAEITCDLRQSGRGQMSDDEGDGDGEENAPFDMEGDLEVVAAFPVRNAAMPFHYFVMGYVSGVINGLLYGILVGTMSLDATQYVTSQAIIVAPWGLKCCIGFVSDNFPVIYHKRRYYCIMGNTLTCAVFVGLCIFYNRPTTREHCDPPDGKCMHFDPTDLHTIVVCFMLVCLGLVVSDSACDGLMVSVSRKQNTVCPSVVPIGCFLVRIVGTTVASTVLIFGFDGEASSGIPLWTVFLSCACLCFAGMLLWYCAAKYDAGESSLPCVGCMPREHEACAPDAGRESHCSQAIAKAGELSKFGCDERFCYFVLYNLIAPIVVNVTSPATGPMRMYWTPTDVQQVTFLVSAVATILSLVALMTWCLQTNWSHIIFAATTCTACVNLPITVFGALGLCRNQYVFMLQDILSPLPAASMYLVATLATVALVPEGHEATIYGLVSTSHILAIPSARALSNLVYGYVADLFALPGTSPFFQQQNYLDDTDEFRLAIVAAACIQCSMMLMSQTLVVLLPGDASEWTQLKLSLETAPRGNYGLVTFTAIFVCFLAGVTLNIMTAVPNIRCTELINGIGCDQSQ